MQCHGLVSPETAPIRAAQYVRMSTEHQQYSLENQADAIARYAQANGMHIVRTYSDAAKSGLSIEDRHALQQLIRDVETGAADFRAILVYDISRWGRFQDSDESAHYEYICKRARIAVHYCAEPFVNDGSLPSSLLKAIKRMMAAEYSRELSAKVFAGKRRLIELGFRQGGTAGYGLRRLLQDQNGNPKCILAFGERKSLMTDRVLLVPGPPREVQMVQEIYRRFIDGGQTFIGIARALNALGIRGEFDRPWTRSMVHTILTNPKYIGANQFNRISKKLNGKVVRNARVNWIQRDNAFEPIISAHRFQQAQEIIADRNRFLTHDEVLNSLRSLLQREGKLSSAIVDRGKGPASRFRIALRFNGLLPAYELAGYKPAHDYSFLLTDKRVELRRKDYIAVLIAELEGVGAVVNRCADTDLLTINGEFTIALTVLRCRHTKHRGYRWRLRSAALLADITVAARMVPDNNGVLDYYVLPRMAGLAPILDLAPVNNFLIDVYRFDDLSVLKNLAYRVPLKGEL
jgi:DNA invertase Pin-like site-specific DNA recombinase